MVETPPLITAGSDKGEDKLHSIDNLSAQKGNKLNRQSTEVREFSCVLKFPQAPCRQWAPANYPWVSDTQVPLAAPTPGQESGFQAHRLQQTSA